jgi:hypothetical protein
MMLRSLAVVGVFALVASTASAQGVQTDHLFVNVNVAAQAGSHPSDTTFTSTVFQEDATVAVNRTIKSGPIYDFAAGLRIRGRIGVAGSVTTWKKASDATAEASIPHPIFYDQPRMISGSVTGLQHQETWVGVLGTWLMPINRKMDLMVLAGPAVAFIVHEVPTSVSVSETSAGPDIRVTLVTEDKQLWGYQAGADVRYHLTSMIGVGGFVRMSGASGHIGDVAKLELGGFEAGGGVRLRF